jgi:Flp pilus assembly protein TadG
MRSHGRVGEERGAIVIGGLLLSLALVLLIGTGVDIAHAFIVRRDLSAIADSAALAGGQRLDLDAWRQGTLALDPRQAEQAAEAELAANPGISGSAQAQPGSVTVEARERFPTIVLGLVGIPELTVTATATATPEKP